MGIDWSSEVEAFQLDVDKLTWSCDKRCVTKKCHKVNIFCNFCVFTYCINTFFVEIITREIGVEIGILMVLKELAKDENNKDIAEKLAKKFGYTLEDVLNSK